MFDIMLPFWGRVDHARDAVRSVLAQTEEDWRLVVIDDAYPDASFGEWVRSIADPRVEYVRNETNLGIGKNFQKSIELSRAEYIVIVGCDDVMLPGYLAHMRRMTQLDPEASFLHAGTEIIDADGHVVSTVVDRAKAFYRPRARGQVSISGEQLAANLLRGNWMNFPAIVWKRSAIAHIGFDQRFSVVQDLELAIDVIVDGGALALDDSVVFQYRRHAESVSSWRGVEGSRFSEEAAYFAETADRMSSLGWNRAARAARRHFSSRINAALTIPKALRARDMASVRGLASHALRRGIGS